MYTEAGVLAGLLGAIQFQFPQPSQDTLQYQMCAYFHNNIPYMLKTWTKIYSFSDKLP